MKRGILTLAAMALLASESAVARELLCEQCIPEPECWEHLFVERCQWFVHGEFLYWGAAAGNLDYANRQTSPETMGVSTFNLGKYETADYEFRPGFRVAASYYNCPKYWEVTAQYTWLDDRGRDSASAPSEANLFLSPTRRLATMGPYDEARSRISLGYQVGDLYAARVFDPNPHLRMRVYGGITLGWLKQEWNISYLSSFGELETVSEDWRFFGGGLRAGITADWFWGCQIYLTARMSCATLYGSYENREIQRSPDRLLSNATYDHPRFAYNVQFILGPSWQIPCDCWSFELFAGYESNLWFNVQERILSSFNLVEDSHRTFYSQSVLGLHGLTLRLTLGF